MKKIIEPTIIWLLLVSVIFTQVYILFTEENVDYSFYLGMFGIILTFVLRIKFINIYKYILGFILVLGTFNIIQFSYIEIEFELSLNNIGIKNFNPVILIFLLAFVSINFKAIKNRLSTKKNNV